MVQRTEAALQASTERVSREQAEIDRETAHTRRDEP
jgi:hypothetical protein